MLEREKKIWLMLSSYYPSRRSVWENLDQGLEYRPSVVMSVHTTEVRILPYRLA